MQKTDELVNTLVKAVDDIQNKKAKGYDTQATVTRIEGGTAYVHIPGGVDETPAQMTITAKKGDTVRVRVANGTAWLVGNATAPPTDDATANAAVVVANTATTMAGDAIESANIAAEAAESAKTSAGEAQASANEAKTSATNANEYATRALNGLSAVESVNETLTWITQHGTMTLTSDTELDPTHVYFVLDPDGDYVVGSTHYSLVIDPDVDDISTYYELTIDESLNNYVGTHLALTSEGLWLLPAASGVNKVLIATGAGSTYTTAGTYIIDSTSATVASFRADGATIGEVLNGRSRTEIGTDGMHIYQRASGSDTTIAHLGYGQGATSGGGTGDAPYYTFGTRAAGTIGNYSVAEGESNLVSSYAGHGEGYSNTVGGLCNHAEGDGNTVTAGGAGNSYGASHVEGELNTISTGRATHSHAEGKSNTISGQNSHAEGLSNTVGGDNAHAEGKSNTIKGNYSHVEGESNTETDNGTYISGSHHNHLEGYQNVIRPMINNGGADYGHIEGHGNIIEDDSDSVPESVHVGGRGNIGKYSYQTVIGKYNATTDKPFIIGKGTADNARSNAFTVDWSGNVDIASGAKYKINGTALSASDVGALPTRPTSIEFQPSSSSAGNGGFIDFHYNQSSADYTSRIIEAASGALTVSGSLTVGGHSSAIGTVKQAYATAKTVNNNTNTNLTSISLEAGTWVITAGVRFPSNATGLRRLNVTTSSGSANADVQLMAVNGGSTQLAYTLVVTPSATTTYYLNCYQNSGSNLSLSAGGGENGLNFIRAVRIA